MKLNTSLFTIHVVKPLTRICSLSFIACQGVNSKKKFKCRRIFYITRFYTLPSPQYLTVALFTKQCHKPGYKTIKNIKMSQHSLFHFAAFTFLSHSIYFSLTCCNFCDDTRSYTLLQTKCYTILILFPFSRVFKIYKTYFRKLLKNFYFHTLLYYIW